MGFFSGVKRVFKPFVDFPRWMQLKRVSTYGKSIKNLASEIFIVRKVEEQESFEQAQSRMGINDVFINKRVQEIKRLLWFYLLLFVTVFGYGFYMMLSGHVRAAFLSFAVSLIAISQAFRQHFWMTQLAHRRLGLDFKTWLNLTLGKKS